MTSTPAIRIENLGKEYRIGRRRALTVRDAVAGLLSRRGLPADERFWALKDVSFEVRPGEVLGVIGRNGAGKSTLLKILSRITEPTEGQVTIHGRVGSLLEVGTGFHADLTGRENVFLNGAILGMRRREILRRFDEIVAFAEVERFIDTPVKHYSSGMYMRLAFAVAAHLDPEVLMVDEVLAVGDAAFQRKCLGKMEDVASGGRTVLFVSHNMAAVSALCTRVICLTKGRVVKDGAPQESISFHLSDLEEQLEMPLGQRTDRQGDGRLRFRAFWLEDELGLRVSHALLGSTVTFSFEYVADGPLTEVYVAFDLQEHFGNAVVNCNTADVGQDFPSIPLSGVFRCRMPRFPLRAGRFLGNVYCSSKGTVHDWIQAAIHVTVEDGDYFGTGTLKNRCLVMADHSWQVSAETRSSEVPASDEGMPESAR